MNRKNILKEAIIWIIILVPIVYYFAVRQQLPPRVPVHFDVQGHPNGYAAPNTFLWYIIGMTLGVYLLMLLVPLIDPKKKIQLMGRKYFSFKVLIVTMMSALSVFMIFNAIHPNFNPKIFLVIIISVVFIAFGNYLPSLKPNYFIGIRTPWTLESEENWRLTHRLAGWLWTIGGLLLLIVCLILPKAFYLEIGITVVLVLIPLIYSFVLYLKQKK